MKKIVTVLCFVLCVAACAAFATACGDTSAGGGTETYVFEAEYTDLSEFKGVGISNAGDGVENIFGEGTEADKKLYSEGYFLSNTYAENTVAFDFVSDKATTGTLRLRLASELGNLDLSEDVFGIEINGTELSYDLRVIGGGQGTYEFEDYTLRDSINIKEGDNTVKLIIKNNTLRNGNSIGAPFIDCIKITTDAELTWTPLLDNPANRGQV